MQRAGRIAAATAIGLAFALPIAWFVYLFGSGSIAGVGLDFTAYWGGVERLVSDGSPYHADLLAGPITNNDFYAGYLYSPALAQLLAPADALGIPAVVPYLVLVATVMLGMTFALWAIWRRFAGFAPRPAVSRSLAVLAVFYAPLTAGLIYGNLNVALGVLTAAILAWPRTLPALGVLAALLKPHGAALTGVALLRRPRSTLAIGIAALAILAVLSPTSWLQMPTAVMHAMLMPLGTTDGNWSLAHAGVVLGLPLVGLAAQGLFALTMLIVAVRRSLRGDEVGALYAGAVLMTFASASSWNHGLTVFLPLTVAAVAAAHSTRQRYLLAGGLALTGLVLVGLGGAAAVLVGALLGHLFGACLVWCAPNPLRATSSASAASA